MCFAGGCKNQTKGVKQSSSARHTGRLVGSSSFASARAHSCTDGERPCRLPCSHEAAATGLLCMSWA